MALKYKLILASGSPRRVDLLNQAGIEPSRLMPMDIDEAPKKSEHPRSLARRLSTEKAEAALAAIKGDMTWKGSYILCRRYGRRRRSPHSRQGGVCRRGISLAAPALRPQPLGLHRRSAW